MTETCFIETSFHPTHINVTGGDVQVLGIASPVMQPDRRQVVFRNRGNELFLIPLDQFVQALPDGHLRFRPVDPMFDLLTMISVPPMKGRGAPWMS